MRFVPVARKISTTEERRQDQSCLLKKKIEETQATDTKNCPDSKSQ
jgi:hypothetical protein